MTEKLTDEQLEFIAKDFECAWGDGIVSMATELLALRAERAKPAQSDWQRAKDTYYDCLEANGAGCIGVIEKAFASIRAEGSAERAKLEAARNLHRELAQTCWEGDSLDGGTLQELLVKHGILVETTAQKPCSQWCNCQHNDAVFPTTCYRLAQPAESGATDWMKEIADKERHDAAVRLGLRDAGAKP